MITGSDPSDRDANLRGIGWMTAAMALFAVEDVLIKIVAKQLPVGQVLVLFGTGGAIVFALLARASGDRWFTRAVCSGPMLLRAAAELVGRLFYILAIALTPLSAATAILQATPIFVVLGATLFFGERVGWRRWCAIVAGLAGVLVILRPAAGDFSALSVLALVGVLGFAGRDLASRAAPRSIGTWILGLYGFLTVVAGGALFSAWDGQPFRWPDLAAGACLAGAVGIGVVAYAALMKAMRTGDIATVTPFRYTRLLFGMVLGVALFDERIDGPMVLGCAVVIASGLFIWQQGRGLPGPGARGRSP